MLQPGCLYLLTKKSKCIFPNVVSGLPCGTENSIRFFSLRYSIKVRKSSIINYSWETTSQQRKRIHQIANTQRHRNAFQIEETQKRIFKQIFKRRSNNRNTTTHKQYNSCELQHFGHILGQQTTEILSAAYVLTKWWIFASVFSSCCVLGSLPPVAGSNPI